MDEARLMAVLQRALGETNKALGDLVAQMQEVALLRAEIARLSDQVNAIGVRLLLLDPPADAVLAQRKH
jgi:hypothetical protein